MEALQIIHPFADTEPFLVGAAATAFAALPEEVLSANIEKYSYYDHSSGWQQDSILNWYINKITVSQLPEELIARAGFISGGNSAVSRKTVNISSLH
ncbi:hypothetical protein [Chitinophaga pinensis]|uniref:Uncharacterized protein n=1 Tax=Chitinophaga pinensis TaxID=79329 RepID=A0A5C6LJ37_9BACT|nr:hypothetical protein [Chitinophaga pinensis]TWV91994.1 hypothetical protein FEF09_28455 [Chitinophaga pinensis]